MKKINKKDNSKLVSYGDFFLPPVVPGPEVDDLCIRVDDFYRKYPKSHKRVKTSDLIKGAYFAIRPECRTNPDWMSQAANSIRDVLYPVLSRQNSVENIIRLFVKYATDNKKTKLNKEFINTFSRLDHIYKKFSDFTHHGTNIEAINEKEYIEFTETDFENLMNDFIVVFRRSLSLQQIYVHQTIDLILRRTEKNEALKRDLNVLFQTNKDAVKYFYLKVNKSWFSWLNNNGFLSKIKEKAENTDQYSLMPELDYLSRIALNVPSKVTNFILDVPISEDNINPEVVDRFLWIIEEMPAEQIKRLSSKIKKENWVYLMRKYNKSGYQFSKIITKLFESGENEALLDIASVMLSVRTKTDMEDGSKRYGADNVFYLDSLSEVGLFEVLANLDEKKAKDVLALATDKLSKIIKLKEKDKDGIFEYEDYFVLYDKNLFELDLRNEHEYNREDFENLVALIKKMIERTIGQTDDTSQARQSIKIIKNIPSCRLAWKLKLFALSQCPELFKIDIKNALFKIFTVGERYFEIEDGAEYHETLIRTFGFLDKNTVQRVYVQKIFNYFLADLNDKDKERWRKRDGGKILSFIFNLLSPKEKKEAKEKFDIDPDQINVKPQPANPGIKSGWVVDRAPDDIGKMSIKKIIEKLKAEYRLEVLDEKYKHDDIFNPRSAEGVGNALKEDVKKRTNEYLEKLNDFFDRELISSHYIYSLLRGIEEMLRDKVKLNIEQAQSLLSFFRLIAESGSFNPYKREEKEGIWTADWVTVHKLACDILLHILNQEKISTEFQSKARPEIIALIKYFLTFAASLDKEDEFEKESDLFTIAINSIRGRAFEVFVSFTQNEGKKLACDIKEIFENVLNDKSLAVRFVVGRYLAIFYFRDKNFIKHLLPEIFPKEEPSMKDIYLATWEGYLSNSLYSQLFDVLSGYYEYAIKFVDEDLTDRKYFKDLNEALAVHLALAYAHFDLKIEDTLFKLFWKIPNVKRHEEFISFIGRSCLSRGHADEEWLKKNNVSKEKLIKFWDFALENISDNNEVLSGFGYWVNYENEIIDDRIVAPRMAKTLTKSGGLIDWDYGLMKRLPVLASKDGKNTFLVIKHYLLDASSNINSDRKGWGLHTDEIKQALSIIYANGNTDEKQKIEELINVLVEKGSSNYWALMDVLNYK